VTCAAGTYCCNAACGICTPGGALCIQLTCEDGGITGDASACTAIASQDSMCSGTTPHYYACVGATLPSPCVTRQIGDLTNTYCCP
jgi:hypothetical protein